MYRVRLNDAQHQELNRRAHEIGVKPRTRDRLEMVRLPAAGWSIPQIAVHLGVCEKRVRHWIKLFLQHGFDALPDRPHPGQRSSLTPAMEEALRQELRRTAESWSAGQIADWLIAHHGVRLTPAYLAERLKRARIAYKRTGRSLKQNPDVVAEKQAEMAGQEKRGTRAHLDEADFAPTLPINYGWYPVGERLRVPYEAPQGRRVNALGAYFSNGPQAGQFLFRTYAAVPESRAKKARKSLAERAAAHGLTVAEVGVIDSERLVSFLWRTQVAHPSMRRTGNGSDRW